MPSIVSFHRNVGHAVILIILFSFFYLATPVCRFIHLLSETTLLLHHILKFYYTLTPTFCHDEIYKVSFLHSTIIANTIASILSQRNT